MKMKTGYEMTAANNSTVGYWEPCKAKTLIGAKREATREYNGGFIGDTIKVGYRDESRQLQVLATASNRDNKWKNEQ